MRPTLASGVAITSSSPPPQGHLSPKPILGKPWWLGFSLTDDGRTDVHLFECPDGDPLPRIRAWYTQRDLSFTVLTPFLAHTIRAFYTEHGWDTTEDMPHVRV